MYICEDCGNIVEFYDDVCSCYGSFVEAEFCETCQEYRAKLYNGICKQCLEEKISLDNAIYIGSKFQTKVEVNDFFANVFTSEQISKILEREYKEACNLNDNKNEIKNYCLNDLECMADLYLELE